MIRKVLVLGNILGQKCFLVASSKLIEQERCFYENNLLTDLFV